MSGIFHMMFNKIAAAIQAAFAVDLDGTNDYFSRSSDLTGNADGKTFTFSAWVWVDTNTDGRIYNTNSNLGYVQYNSTYKGFQILLTNTSGVTILAADASASAVEIPLKTWAHLLISVDMASTSNRFVYINDVQATTAWGTYTNADIDFTQTTHSVGARNDGVSKVKGRLSNVFLDYTYRDLSVEANRRLFITADRKPASGQAALNPIIYLPMDDPTTAHVNQGTGGNFTLNGTIARSGRGPNQYNVAYSDLDGAADYLSRATPGITMSNSSQFTAACCFSFKSTDGGYSTIITNTSTGYIFYVRLMDSNSILVSVRNDATSTVLAGGTVTGLTLTVGRNYHLVLSCDLTDTGKRFVYLNGNQQTVNWTTYTSATIPFSNNNDVKIGNIISARLGSVFFHTSYIDLSVPANLAKFVTGTGIDAKPVDLGADGSLPLGVQPLIYLPMYGNNAGKNYGSGGDFTVNSGPYPGARGPSEFWGNKANFNGSTGVLGRTSALSGVSSGKIFCASFYANFTGTTTRSVATIMSASGTQYMQVDATYNAGNYNIFLFGQDSTPATSLYAETTANFASGQHHILIYIDLSSTLKRGIYVDGVAATTTWTTYDTTKQINLAGAYPTIGARWDGATYGQYFNSSISEFYFTTEYIDFSQESNRLKFRDAFGSPVDLTPQITAGSIPNPAVYMRFDPANQGKNYGTGGDFTKSGTINDGGQL